MLTVVTPAPSRSLLSLQELRAAAGVTDGQLDESLTRHEEIAAEHIARFLGCEAPIGSIPTIRQEVLRETIRNHFAVWQLRLARRFVTSVSSITYDGETVDPAVCELNSHAGLLERYDDAGNPMRWGARPVIVEYTCGFQYIPPIVKEAARRLVRLYISVSNPKRDPLLRRESIEGVGSRDWQVPANVTTSDTLPEDVASLLRGV